MIYEAQGPSRRLSKTEWHFVYLHFDHFNCMNDIPPSDQVYSFVRSD